MTALAWAAQAAEAWWWEDPEAWVPQWTVLIVDWTVGSGSPLSLRVHQRRPNGPGPVVQVSPPE